MKSVTVEMFTSVPVAEHGEGPVWDDDSRTLVILDMLAGDIVSLDHLGTVLSREHVGDVATLFRRTNSGGRVIGRESDVLVERLEGQAVAVPIPVGTGRRLNEGTCAPDGSLYIGSLGYKEEKGAGRLWRVTKDLQVSEILRDVTISNGMTFSADGRFCYFIDSTTRRVDLFDVENGLLGNRRVHADLSDIPGLPDGMASDSDGNLYVAMWQGGRVIRIDPKGHVSGTILLPVSQVTSCCFGAADSGDLYITTSSFGLDSGPDAIDGCVFRAMVGVSGLAIDRFAT